MASREAGEIMYEAMVNVEEATRQNVNVNLAPPAVKLSTAATWPMAQHMVLTVQNARSLFLPCSSGFLSANFACAFCIWVCLAYLDDGWPWTWLALPPSPVLFSSSPLPRLDSLPDLSTIILPEFEVLMALLHRKCSR
jgi:hypothetical protein